MGAPEKNQIYYARTYRHLQINCRECILYLLLFILPSIILILLFYDELTFIINQTAAWVLAQTGNGQFSIDSEAFIPWLGPVYYMEMPTLLPAYGFILANLGIALVLIWLLLAIPKTANPISTYLVIQLLVHTMACIFFLFGRNDFPYTVTEYTSMYMKQQVSIWVTFLLLMGLIMALLSRGGIIRRVLAVLALMLYCFVFALVRYILFLLILHNFSIIYMPILFFALGPFFDFLYFVEIYAICTNSLSKTYETTGRGAWLWA